jgi:hypothetical protein
MRRRTKEQKDAQIIERLVYDMCSVLSWKEDPSLDFLDTFECFHSKYAPQAGGSGFLDNFPRQDADPALQSKRDQRMETKKIDALRDLERKTSNYEKVIWGRKQQQLNTTRKSLESFGTPPVGTNERSMVVLPRIRAVQQQTDRPLRRVSSAGTHGGSENKPTLKRASSWQTRIDRTNRMVDNFVKMDRFTTNDTSGYNGLSRSSVMKPMTKSLAHSKLKTASKVIANLEISQYVNNLRVKVDTGVSSSPSSSPRSVHHALYAQRTPPRPNPYNKHDNLFATPKPSFASLPFGRSSSGREKSKSAAPLPSSGNIIIVNPSKKVGYQRVPPSVAKYFSAVA